MSTPSPSVAELHVRESGTGAAVLLLHGWGGDHTVWNGQIGSLAERMHVLAPDLRGHGQTPAPNGSTFGFDELEGDLDAMLERRGVSTVHLIGLSAGGFLALRYALDHPNRVLSLSLVGSAGVCDGHTRATAAHWAEVYRTQGYEAFIMRLIKDLYYPEWLEQHMDVIDRALESMKGRDLKSVVQWGLALRSFDVRSQLGRIRVPTYVLHGMDDRVVDPSHARLMRQAIRGAELKLFPYAGHVVPVERAEEFTRAITEWYARIPAPSTGAPRPA
ncbi:MAG TPA: alpha/beta fold hydrolase [Thermoplasmata archaeon]|nr:alpha/beta fold hydrolase [Thermoplasmata archaeon]